MGKPTLNTIENGSFMRGPDAYANDGAILGEIHGNLEPKINIKEFNNLWLVTVDWKVADILDYDATDNSTWAAVGTYFDVFTLRLSRKATLIKSHHISYDKISDASASGSNPKAFYGVSLGAGVFHHGGGYVTNAINVRVRRYFLNQKGTNTDYEEPANHAITIIRNNTDYEGTADLDFSEKEFFRFQARRSSDNSGCHATFNPWTQSKFLFKGVHV